MNQSSADGLFQFSDNGTNYTAAVLPFSGNYSSMNSTEKEKLKERTINTLFAGLQRNNTKPANNTNGNLTTPTQNSTRPSPLAPLNLSAEGHKETIPFFIPTGNPAVDALKRLGVNARPVQEPSSVITPITEEVLVQINPASLNNSANLMGPYRNNGRREKEPEIYNPKYDIRIEPNNSSGAPNVLNQINSASLNNEKGVLYHNDGTQYGYRSIRNPAYDIRISPNDSSIGASPSTGSNQINPASLNLLTGPYYNDGTRYRDRSIKNPVYDIITTH